MEVFQNGGWYGGMTPGGALMMFKADAEQAAKIASGESGIGYHLLRIIPGQNPSYVSAILGVVDPVVINGHHFVTMAKCQQATHDEYEALLTRHFAGPPKIQAVESPLVSPDGSPLK